jgi:hypothetical protein
MVSLEGDFPMCSKCDEINVAIERYQRLKDHVNDHQVVEAAKKLIAKLEADKLSLHPEQ